MSQLNLIKGYLKYREEDINDLSMSNDFIAKMVAYNLALKEIESFINTVENGEISQTWEKQLLKLVNK